MRTFYVCVALGMALIATALIAIPLTSANWGLSTTGANGVSMALIGLGVLAMIPMSYYSCKAGLQAHMEVHVEAALAGRTFHEQKPETIEMDIRDTPTDMLY